MSVTRALTRPDLAVTATSIVSPTCARRDAEAWRRTPQSPFGSMAKVLRERPPGSLRPGQGRTADRSGRRPSVRALCTYFENYLTQTVSSGLCIPDSRTRSKILRVSHSIFTQKFGATASYRCQIELPTLGHSDNHAGPQICDIVCSGLLYPIACFAYCTGHVNNVHVQAGASRLRRRYGQQVKALQHRYYDAEAGRHIGGVVVSDYLDRRRGSLMFGG